jgi:hypothetical protein
MIANEIHNAIAASRASTAQHIKRGIRLIKLYARWRVNMNKKRPADSPGVSKSIQRQGI